MTAEAFLAEFRELAVLAEDDALSALVVRFSGRVELGLQFEDPALYAAVQQRLRRELAAPLADVAVVPAQLVAAREAVATLTTALVARREREAAEEPARQRLVDLTARRNQLVAQRDTLRSRLDELRQDRPGGPLP